jgi:hypothetical protein
MTVVGPADEIARFKRVCIREGRLDFNAIEPMPEFADDPDVGLFNQRARFPKWYEWSCEHWGTKWNAHDFHVEIDEPERFKCVFDTAWSPPVPIWKKMGKLFPILAFSLDGFEPDMDFAFEGTIRDGTLELRDVPLICTTTNPATGETISGTLQEIEEFLAKLEMGAKCGQSDSTDDVPF